MARWAIAAGLAAMMAGCGGGASAPPGNMTAQADGASTSNTVMSDARTASGGSNDCSKNPDFAPIYTGATPTICSSTHFGNTGKDAGSFHYDTAASPAEVLAFARASAERSGLTVRIANDTMVSAGEGNTRTFMTMALPDGTGSKVTVNWGVVR